jgi:peptidoglycan/xylan/chitin deacetylase (PgdA/CDA1 family)
MVVYAWPTDLRGHVHDRMGGGVASRRAVLRGAALTIGGAVAGAAGAGSWLAHRRPPLAGGYAPAADALGAILRPSVDVTYYVQTTEPVVAFTFDDGPLPHWTPMVLNTLDKYQVPATFFLVGRNVVRHGGLLRGRLDRHEVGNHSWSHPDLATLDLTGVHGQLLRTHAAILAATGRVPRLMRPPYGHLGGSTLLAADAFGYDVVLWSQQMHEEQFLSHPDDEVNDIVDKARPGAIILAHDVGPSRRLVALNRLGAMFVGLAERGFRLVTVSELLSLGTAVTQLDPAIVPAPRQAR